MLIYTNKLGSIPIYEEYKEIEIKEVTSGHIWITAKGVKVSVSSMSTKHINNCIKCWLGKGNMRIPKGYLGGKNKWLAIFNEELIKRQ